MRKYELVRKSTNYSWTLIKSEYAGTTGPTGPACVFATARE